jgi:hypothetical protein
MIVASAAARPERPSVTVQRWEELMNPVETLAYLQAVVDRMLGKSPRISDRQVMIAVLRTLADREERRAGLSDDDDGPPPMPVTHTA